MVGTMEDLKRMAIFSHVVEAGGFSAAARRIGMAKSAVSKHIAELERQIGVRLLTRTTRRLSLTDAGEVYYQACSRIVSDAAEATRQISGQTDHLSGTLRISCPIALGNEYIAPMVKLFADHYTELKVELFIDDQIVNMVEEGIDVAIRIGWLPDSNLIARKLTNSPRFICASPAYLQEHSIPDTPEDLVNHEWIIFTLLPTPHTQILTKHNRKQKIRVNGRFKTNNALTLRALLLQDAGIGILSEFLVAEDIKQNRLIQLLPDYDAGSAGVYAVYPDKKYVPQRVQLFIEYLINHFKI